MDRSLRSTIQALGGSTRITVLLEPRPSEWPTLVTNTRRDHISWPAFRRIARNFIRLFRSVFMVRAAILGHPRGVGGDHMYVFIEELAVGRMAELQREMERSHQTSARLSEGIAIFAVWLRRITGRPFARPVRRGFTRMVEVDGERG